MSRYCCRCGMFDMPLARMLLAFLVLLRNTMTVHSKRGRVRKPLCVVG